MIYKKKYVQFNEIVFDGVGLVDADDSSASFKDYTADYTFRHGQYAPQKVKGGLLRARRVSMTISLNMKGLPCDQRLYYHRFARKQLTTQGRLWAVQGDRLLWAYAYVTSYSESDASAKDTLEIDINFNLPEGIWHKADKLKTFLVPHDVCDFMDCEEFETIDPCRKSPDDCCNCGATEPNIPLCDCCDPCDKVGEENALCYHKDLSDFYECEVPWKIIYSCEAAEKFFGDPLSNTNLGQKFCNPCGNLIAGRFYSDTDLPTSNVTIRLHGTMHNPYIEINGNGNIIQGDYEGFLDIHPNGEVYAYKDDCGPCDPLPVTAWVIPDGMTLGWTIEQGYNRFVIDGGTCCHLCAYIMSDELSL